MEGIKLSLDKQVTIGDGFDYYRRSIQSVIGEMNEVNALLRYKDLSMVASNKQRALTDIDIAIEYLQELREAINEVKEVLY